MYYLTYTATLLPGKRFAGVDHMKKLAKIIHDKYGITSEILANSTGKVYDHHFVSKYESMAQIEQVGDKLLADDDYHTWFEKSKDLVAWKDATINLYRVFD